MGFTAAIIGGVAASAISTGISMYGQKKAAKASAKAGTQAAEDNSKQIRQVAQDNARLANSEAVNVELESREQIARMGQQNKSALATMRASMGASGFTMDSGSNLDIMGATAGRLAVGIADVGREAAMKAARFRYDGARGLYEANAQANLGIKQANTEAKNTKAAAKTSMIATGVGGVADAFTGYSKIFR